MKAVIPNEHDDDSPPEFGLSAWNGEGDARDEVKLLVHTTSQPRIDRHASLGLLYGLAILVLDQQGAIAKVIDSILDSGPINEVDAVNRINFLLQEDYNEQTI